MSLDVNLSIQQEPKKPLPRTVVYGIIFSTVSAAVFLGVLFFNIILSREVSRLEARESELKERIEELLTSEGSYVTLARKIREIEKIIQDRPPVDARLSQIFSQVPRGIEISQIDVSPEALRVSLTTTDLALINEFLETDLDEISASDPEIEKIDIISFERSDVENSYIGTVLITYQL